MIKENHMRTVNTLFLAALLFLSCGIPAGADSLNVAELERRIAGNRNDLAVARVLIHHYFETDRVDDLVLLFEANRLLFENEPAVRVYYAAGLCKMAGMATDVNEQIRWMKEGLVSFEELAGQYPSDLTVRLFRGLTYSFFPKSAGLKPAAQEDLDLCLEKNRNKEWNLTGQNLALIYESCLRMSVEYGDGEYLAYCYGQMKTDIPDHSMEIFKAYEKAISSL
jgi:hypothetical protein